MACWAPGRHSVQLALSRRRRSLTGSGYLADPPPSDLIVSFYTLGTLVATLVATGLMILRAHQAAKKVAIEQVLVEEGDEIEALLDQKYEKDP